MRARGWALWVWAAVAVLLSAAALFTGRLQPQQPESTDGGSAAQTDESPSDSIQLVFEREVFTYPGFERRNPFRPLTGEEATGPRFQDMVLLGVVLSPRTDGSIAVLGARPPGATSDQPATRVFRLRSGESVGNVRVIEIRRREVLFAVEDFGTSETRILEMRRSERHS